MLNFVRLLLAVRRESAPLRLGSLDKLSAESDVLRFERAHESQRVEVLVNFAHDVRTVTVTAAQREISCLGAVNNRHNVLTLAPGESVIRLL